MKHEFYLMNDDYVPFIFGMHISAIFKQVFNNFYPIISGCEMQRSRMATVKIRTIDQIRLRQAIRFDQHLNSTFSFVSVSKRTI